MRLLRPNFKDFSSELLYFNKLIPSDGPQSFLQQVERNISFQDVTDYYFHEIHTLKPQGDQA